MEAGVTYKRKIMTIAGWPDRSLNMLQVLPSAAAVPMAPSGQSEWPAHA